jgi:hypothetical protein
MQTFDTLKKPKKLKEKRGQERKHTEVGGKKDKNIKNQKPVEYPGLLSYIIGMMNTTFSLFYSILLKPGGRIESQF